MTKHATLLSAVLLALVSTLSYAQAAIPFVNQPLIPDTTAPGGPQFTLTVNGTGFVSNSVVNWNGSARETTFVNGSRLTAIISASDIAKHGTGEVTVFNPSPGGGTSNAIPFEVARPISLSIFNRSDYPAGNYGTDVVAADFNGDGNLDLAVANYGSGPVGIYLGNSHGRFHHHGDYPTGVGAPDALVVGDFNGDGKLDLAVRGGAVLLGNGDGSFQAPLTFNAGNNGGLAAGDFNGDGKLDLAATDNGGGVVQILLGNGDGTFQMPVGYAAGGSSPWGIAVGDFNGDGKLDLVVALTDGSDAVAILLGYGDGTFQPAVTYAVAGAHLWELYAADLSGDGVLDLVVPTDSGVAVLPGNGDGTFRAPAYYSLGTYGRGFAADVNNDGKLDLVITDGWRGNGYFVLLGNGDGTFRKPRSYSTPTGDCPFGAAFGDFNQDGILDMAFADWCTSELHVMLGTVIELDPDALDFGTVSVGQQASLAAQLTNVRKEALDIKSISIPGVSGAFSQTNDCGSSVGPGQSCTITVTFTPPQAGHFAAPVIVWDQAPGSPQRIFLSGQGSSANLAGENVRKSSTTP